MHPRKIPLDFGLLRAHALIDSDDGRLSRDRGAERLRAFVNAEIPSGGLVVVANREPYLHQRNQDGTITIERPAGGLVNGIEPMLRACGGTWIGFGGGSADRDFCDDDGRLDVPPEAPEYTLRRVWADPDEYERYYSGFANEGLWPLCHLTHTRPRFRRSDWAAYQSVNEEFARVAAEEARQDAFVLIQDYHFALVPRMIRNRAPEVVTSLFWHIPWPNAEMFAICPWKEELLDGMAGADILGFQTRDHCLNFLEAAQRYLECRVNREEMSITTRGHRTLVRTYPISVEWPFRSASRLEGRELRRALGISPQAHIALGVDRADYTKGLLERVAAVDQLLEKNPSLIGRFVFVQLAAPSRTSIPEYQRLATELEDAVKQVNERYGTAGWTPVILQMRTYSPPEVRAYYAMANSAVVTPLHDGMNLVAKEYVASCQDGDGVLVLSVFAGAAKELDNALLVNPYDNEEISEALLRAVRMPLAERRARMHRLRERIASNSIYDWSEKLLRDMRDVQLRRARSWRHQTAIVAAPAAFEVGP